MADYLPFGAGSPAEQAEVGPSFFDRLVAGIINGTVSIPKRVMDATAATAPGLRREDFTDIPATPAPFGFSRPEEHPGSEMRGAALEAALMTMGATPFGVPGGGAVLGSGPTRGIRAYHGSPHDFDKFDLSKIGTGEGAQAYGHGLYFAEREGTAKAYRDQLAKGTIDFGGKRMSPAELSDHLWKSSSDQSPETLRGIMDAVHELTATGRHPVPPSDLKSWMGYGPMAQREGYAYAANQLEKAKATPGRMYEVNINADPDHFLDWDKPLSQQSEKVREGVRNSLVERGIATPVANYLRNSDRPGRDALTALARGEYDTRIMPPEGEPAALASAKLREAGIPGIKYLDQGSRAAGEGSRNYVVFDDSLIDIIRKYGIAGAGPVGFLASGAPQNEGM